MTTLRKKSIVLIEAEVVSANDKFVVVNVLGSTGANLELYPKHIKSVVSQPFEAGDAVRWYPKAEAPMYRTGNFVGMLRDSQVAICRGYPEDTLYEVDLSVDKLMHEDLDA